MTTSCRTGRRGVAGSLCSKSKYHSAEADEPTGLGFVGVAVAVRFAVALRAWPFIVLLTIQFSAFNLTSDMQVDTPAWPGLRVLNFFDH